MRCRNHFLSLETDNIHMHFLLSQVVGTLWLHCIMIVKRRGSHLHPRQCAHSDYVALWYLHFQHSGESGRNRQTLTEHSIKVRPFLFPLTIGKCDLIYSECVKVFFVRSCRVFFGSQGQTQSLFFLTPPCFLRSFPGVREAHGESTVSLNEVSCHVSLIVVCHETQHDISSCATD